MAIVTPTGHIPFFAVNSATTWNAYTEASYFNTVLSLETVFNINFARNRGVGSIKSLGGAPASRDTLVY